MTGGVVRRDGLRGSVDVCRHCGASARRCSDAPDAGAVKCCPDCDHREPTELRDLIARTLVEAGCNDPWHVVYRCAAEVARVLDAVPAVPPDTPWCDEECVSPVERNGWCPTCPNVNARRPDAPTPVVPPDPPAVDRDELAREMYATQLRDPLSQKHMRDAWDEFPHVRGVWLQRAAALLSSGVLAAAADVRASALEDAAGDARRSVGAADGLSLTHEAFADWLEFRAAMERKHADRAVSEREGDRS